ncbi:MAG: TMEM175 family protein, partial [Methanobacterium sp.]
IDKTLLWITLIWLLFVALVPFSASLNGEYGNLTSASVFFGFNMFFIGILLFLIWYYATEKNLTRDDLSVEDVKSTRRINLALPIASVISIGLAFVIPSWSYLAYFLIPVIHNIIEKDHWRK